MIKAHGLNHINLNVSDIGRSQIELGNS